MFIILALPASPNYILKSFEFTGGGIPGQSSQYKAETIVGGSAQGPLRSSSYQAGSGILFMQQSNVVGVTLTNDASWYNKLKVTILPGTNHSNTLYAIAISNDNFATTNYVQGDGTVGASLGIANYRTYAGWGSASGSSIIGLAPNTTYYVKARSLQGDFTEGSWGPVSSAATSAVTLTFDIDVSATDQNTDPPYSVALGTLSPGNVITASDKIWVSIATNAESGGVVYASGENVGLESAVSNYTITSSTQDLSAGPQGYGIRANSASQTSGGPLASQPPYDSTGDNVGVVDTVLRPVFKSTLPLVGGRGSLLVKAKAAATTPSSTDYTDTLTLLAAGQF